MFVTSKDDGLIPFVLTQILDACVNGVTLSDPDLPDSPIVYANQAFEEMSGYSQEEILGRNCRFLQGDDRDQECLATIREALAKNAACVVTLRNYRKNKELFLNRLSIRPLVDWLDYNGFNVVKKPAREQIDAQGKRRIKGNMDVDMAVDIL